MYPCNMETAPSEISIRKLENSPGECTRKCSSPQWYFNPPSSPSHPGNLPTVCHGQARKGTKETCHYLPEHRSIRRLIQRPRGSTSPPEPKLTSVGSAKHNGESPTRPANKPATRS